MSSLNDDYNAEIQLVIKEYNCLKKLNPNHDLLSLIEIEGGYKFTSGKELLKKYLCDMNNTNSRCGALIKYEEDLKKAVRDELRKKIGNEEVLGILRTHEI